jgi:putative peptidoglycan lipid II flippase
MIKVFAPGFFAREDTKRPMYFAMTSVAVNVIAAFTLSRFIGHIGIAIATATAAWVNATLLGLTLQRRGFYRPDERIRSRLPRILLASLLMGAILMAAFYYLRPLFEGGYALWLRALVLLGLVALGGISYFLLAHLTGAMKIAEMRAMLRI